jgi:MscS family membrane protein
VAGTVEKIGLRSTRIRTLDRTVVTLPNGKVADSKIETFAARDRIRLACTLGLEYGTTVDQMRAVLAGIEQALRAHPKIWPDTVTVAFKAFGESSLDVEVMAWFQTADWNEFVAIRQEMFLAFMRVVQEAGTGFAFPTRTVRVVQEGTGDRGQGTGTGVRGRA